jgi:diguanylate cyclase (GGDEF)-like protein/PAS domain S-box-containing protein
MAETSQRRASRRAALDTVRHRSVVETSVDGILTIDEHGTVQTFNAAAERMFGFAPDEVIGENVRRLMPEPFRRGHDGYPERYRETGDARVIGSGREAIGIRKDGTTFPIHLSIGEMRIEGARMFTGIIRDLTEQRAAEDARRASERELRVRGAQQSVLQLVGERALRLALDEALADVATQVADPLSAEFVVLCQADTATLEAVIVSSHGQDAIPVGARAPLSDPLLFNAAMRDRSPFVVDDLPADARFAASPAVERLKARSAATVPIVTATGVWGAMAALSLEPAHFDQEDLVFLGAVANIVAAAVERARVEDELRHQALHDALTGVANRTLLRDRIGHALGLGRRVGSRTAVIFLDLDHFKDVNDTYGHDVGDALLVAAATRLAAAIRPADTLARLGGDEFVAVCEDIADANEAIATAERLLAVLAEPLLVSPRVQVTASVGVVICTGAYDADSALRDADTAMYRAKHAGRGRIEVFDVATRRRLLARIKTRDELDAALERDELLLYYQPVVDLGTGLVAGVEGLVRWNHPERGIVGPHAFIPIAEETGQIREIGRFVIEQACADAARWNAQRPGVPALGVSVNLSARQLGGGDLVEHAKRCAATARLPAGQLGLEITETVLLEDNAAHLREIAELRAGGIRILLDDFGTGYASLAYLQRFDPDVLKLDRSFVAGLGANPRDTAIVSSVAGMAAALDLMLVAEGVERREQVASLQLLDCGYAQGYFFARPQPAERIDRLRDGVEHWRLPAGADRGSG